MRIERALVVGGLSLLGAISSAQSLRVELEGPDTLRREARATLELRVWAQPAVPVMVTPRAEGAALEVVRGRLLRPDAVDPGASPLVFRIPVVAREPGPARVRVRTETFECAGEECEPRSVEVARALRVER